MKMNKVERIASSGLRYFFAPQITGGARGVKSLFAAFVQTLAQTLARANLLSPTHRSLNPTSLNDIRLGEILVTSYATLRAPGGRKADQFAVFGAVFGLLMLTTLCVMTFVVNTLIGTAHAALTGNAADPGACVISVSPSIFDAPCATDMAQQWIDVLLLNDTTSWFYNQVSSLPLTAGMAAMFGTYSVGMLILAGFLVLYHLLSVVAETASQGHVGGRNFNHVWAPIRMIMAVGMLVPLGVAGGGLNSGQYVVTQFAKMGSGLASNAWAGFATTSIETLGSYIIIPSLPPIAGTMKEALKIKVCQKYFDMLAMDDIYQYQVAEPSGWNNAGSTKEKNITKTWDGEVVVGAKPTLSGLCGFASMSNPSYEPTGSNITFLSTGSISAATAFRNKILGGHRDALDDAMGSGSKLDTLSKKIVDSIDPNIQYQLTETDMNDFNDAIEEYRDALSTAIESSIQNSADLQNFKKDATGRGWVSAAVWFNTIARLNGQLIDASTDKPNIYSSINFPGVDDVVVSDLQQTLAQVDEQLESLYSSMQSGASKRDAPESDYAASLGATISTSSSNRLEKYLSGLSTSWTKLLGSDAGGMQDVSPSTAVTGAATYRLNTANPLAELSALGTRIVDLSMKASENANSCASVRYATKNDPASEAEKTACEAAGGDTTGSFLIASITSALMVSGMTLAFLLPLMPFIRFMFGLLTWIVALFEAVVAIPLVALAHIKTEGEGLAGPMARGAYLLILQIFARPILMVFGLIVALLVFNLMIVALNEMYSGVLRGVEGGGTISAMAGVAYTVIYACLAYAMANASFKAIDVIPNQALQWIGGHSVASLDESHRVASGVGQMGSMVGQNSTQLMGMRQREYTQGLTGNTNAKVDAIANKVGVSPQNN